MRRPIERIRVFCSKDTSIRMPAKGVASAAFQEMDREGISWLSTN